MFRSILLQRVLHNVVQKYSLHRTLCSVISPNLYHTEHLSFVVHSAKLLSPWVVGVNSSRTLKSVPSKNPYPPLDEDELEESFCRGSGPGGQKRNTQDNQVVLKHVPTGLVVICHETRTRFQNQKLARFKLQKKLDWFYNGENALEEIKRKDEISKKREKTRKSKIRLQKKKEFKEREGLN